MSCKTVTGSVVDGISSMRVSGAREKVRIRLCYAAQAYASLTTARADGYPS